MSLSELLQDVEDTQASSKPSQPDSLLAQPGPEKNEDLDQDEDIIEDDDAGPEDDPDFDFSLFDKPAICTTSNEDKERHLRQFTQIVSSAVVQPIAHNIDSLVMKQKLGLDSAFAKTNRYSQAIQRNKLKRSFRPNMQPQDPQKWTPKGEICYANFDLKHLLDPLGLSDNFAVAVDQSLVKSLVDLGKKIETKRELAPAFSVLESTFIVASLARLQETWRLTASLIQRILFDLPPTVFGGEKKHLEHFQQTMVASMNQLTDELHSMEPLFQSHKIKSSLGGYDSRLLKLHLRRLKTYPLNAAATSFGGSFSSNPEFSSLTKEIDIRDVRSRERSFILARAKFLKMNLSKRKNNFKNGRPPKRRRKNNRNNGNHNGNGNHQNRNNSNRNSNNNRNGQGGKKGRKRGRGRNGKGQGNSSGSTSTESTNP